MIEFVWGKILGVQVIFADQEYPFEESRYPEVKNYFQGDYLETFFLPKDEGALFVGTGTEDLTDRHILKELTAKASRQLKKLHLFKFTMILDKIMEYNDASVLTACTEGLCLGLYDAPNYKSGQKEETWQVSMLGIPGKELDRAKQGVAEGAILTEAVTFAREMTNRPGNKLRPMDFTEELRRLMEDTKIDGEILLKEDLEKMGMGALLGVGGSSDNPPCMMVVRYRGNPAAKEITGLVGKGVTFDTGGYCLKSRDGLIGMQGDMGGAAAVAGAMYALAKRRERINVTAVIPLCENRISAGSLVPGDVLTSYSGKTIEVENTDAEGRLILADAVSYAVKKERVTRVLDIATLTGAVVSMLGHTIGGVLCDDMAMWEEFRDASVKAGEKYWLLPFGKEHEKMLESRIADLKNMGDKFCGTITAGLFIRHFAEGIPWIHVDIAGTAWADKPQYEYQNAGATGAGVETIYYWLKTNHA